MYKLGHTIIVIIIVIVPKGLSDHGMFPQNGVVSS